MLEKSLREIDCSLEYKLDRGEGCPQSSTAELRRPKSGVATTGDMARGRAAALQRGTTQRIFRNLKQGEEQDNVNQTTFSDTRFHFRP